MGATSGIGFCTAERFLSEGYTVGVAGRRSDKLQYFTEKYPERCYSAEIDITVGVRIEDSIDAGLGRDIDRGRREAGIPVCIIR